MNERILLKHKTNMNLICKAVKDQTDQNVHSWEEKDWHFYFETYRILTMKKMCLREVLSEWLEWVAGTRTYGETLQRNLPWLQRPSWGQKLMKMATMKTVIQAKTMARVSPSNGCSLCSSYSALFLLWSYRKQNIAFNESMIKDNRLREITIRD